MPSLLVFIPTLYLCFVLLQAVMTMVPEAWQNDPIMPENKKAFYRWSAYAMEPWDGPGMNITQISYWYFT